MIKGHWPDCAIYQGVRCDCGGLDMRTYGRFVYVKSAFPTREQLAAFVAEGR